MRGRSPLPAGPAPPIPLGGARRRPPRAPGRGRTAGRRTGAPPPGARAPTSSRRRCSSSRSGSRRLPSASSTARPTGTTATAAAPSSIRARTASIASSGVAAYWTVGSSPSSEIAAARRRACGCHGAAGASRRFATSSRHGAPDVGPRRGIGRGRIGGVAAAAGGASSSDRTGQRGADGLQHRRQGGRRAGGRETTRTRLTGAKGGAARYRPPVVGVPPGYRLSIDATENPPDGQPADSTPGTREPLAPQPVRPRARPRRDARRRGRRSR